ncbi:SDR family oxidoreductase [uncultured Microbulbifer sp.]|uniref:SDR family oxidoreductase n=1 Tax=uncultured Microbulbifer sp. TaxID=348147 RepID=UPI00260A567B|nr:SDR family oxidoreductase [uncultured Microbulbifer sp.]
MKHAFVTGASGFLGTNLVEQLCADGWQVTAMHRHTTDTRRLRSMGVALVEGYLEDPDSLRTAIPKNVDVLFHIAANTSLWRGGNAQQWRDNVTGSANIARVAREKNVGRLIVTSSIAAYGYHSEIITENSEKRADNPHHHYLYTKKRGELAVQREIALGLDAVFLNPCAIVGKYDTHNWAQTFFLIDQGQLPGVPPGYGSFCHAGAVARAHIDAVEKGRCGENYILAGTDASFLEFFGKIAELRHKPVPKRTSPAFVIHSVAWCSDLWSRVSRREPVITPQKATLVTGQVVASSAKAERELDYQSGVALETMLCECHDWLVQQKLLEPK